MKPLSACFLFILLFSISRLWGQSDMNRLIHKELPGTHGFIRNDINRSDADNFLYPDNISSDHLKAYYETPGIKKSTHEDFGETPDWVWVKQFGGTTGDIGRAVTSDAMGNIYAAGTFSGTMIIGEDTLESTGSDDMLIMKLSQTCYPLWYKHVISTSEEKPIIPESIILDNSGNIIVTGYFDNSSITIGGTILNRTGNRDIFITKLNGSGNFTWSKSYGESGKQLNRSKVRSDATNNYYMIYSEEDAYTAMIKYNSSGQMLSNLSKSDCSYLDIEIYNTSIYLTGTFKGYAEFGSTVLMPGQSAIFLAKCDLSGNFLWAKGASYEGYNGGSTVWDLAVDNNENLYLSGFLSDKAIWGNDTIEVDVLTSFISKVNSDGQINWTKYTDMGNFVYHEYRTLFTDNQNNLYVYGWTTNYIAYEGVNIIYTDFILKCNSDGNALWAEKIDPRPIAINRYGADKMITAGIDIYGNLLVSRYSSNVVEEYTTHFKGNSGTASISGMETDVDADLFSYGNLSGSGEIFGRTFQNFRGCFLSKHNSRGELIWIEFIEGAGATTYTFGQTFILDKNHNCLFLLGNINDTLKIGTETLLPEYGDQFLAKYNTDGVFEWVHRIKNIPGSTSSISGDNSGNLIFSGTGTNAIIGDSIFITDAGSNDAYIAKYDLNGLFKWAFSITNTNLIYDAISSTDKNNMIYFTGEFYPGEINFNGSVINTESDSEGDIIFAKLDPNGTPLFIKTFGRGKTDDRYNTWPVNLVTDPEGYSYMFGWYGDSVYFDDFLLSRPLNNSGKYYHNFFITKIDPVGNVLWINSIFEEKFDFNYNEMELDENGNCYVMAGFRDTIRFGDDITLPNTGERDLFIAKYYSNGNLAWIKSIVSTTGLNRLQGLAVFDSLSLYVGGTFINQVSFEPVTLETKATSGFIALLSQERLNCMDITSSCSDYVCPGKSDGYIDISITGGTPPYTYEWSNGAVTEDLEYLESGEYSVTAVDDRLCIVRKTIMLDPVVTYQDSELCMVTVNNNNKIILVWEKPYDQDIHSYRLYREKTKDNYIKIAEVPFENLSVYVDEGSTPDEYSHFYKIKAVDVCGDSSEFSPYHKSIHLWTALGVSGEVTLTWDEYQGFDYDQYIIYRGTSLNDLSEIRRISSSSKSWTDPSPPAGQVYYRVQVVKPEPCIPTSKKAEEYGSSVSNYDEEIIGAIEPASGQSVTIFPNPFKEKTRIIFTNPDHSEWQLSVTDLAGKLVRKESHITTGEFELERGNLPAGTYLLELSGERIFRGKLVIVNE